MKRIICIAIICATVLNIGYFSHSQQVVQYKMLVRDVVSDLVDGKVDEAITELESIMQQFPNDLEAYYAYTIVYGMKGEMETALNMAKKAVELGLPKERFAAGPRDLFQPLYENAAFQNWLHDTPLFLHGPMVGSVTANSAKIWLRTSIETDAQVTYYPVTDIHAPMQSEIVQSSSAHDYTAVIPISGLQPNTNYVYTIAINGKTQNGKWMFSTFPSAGAKAKFDIGFGGGAGYTPQHERMWETLDTHPMLAFLFMGDNVYIDNPTRPAVQQYCYYRRQSVPAFRFFTATRSIFSIWDDHDFTTNDKGGGPEIDTPSWKRPVWELFKENWVNPAFGGGDKDPGCWYTFSIGDVDFFMLDGRYYRTHSEQPNPRMLGSVQMQWLKDALHKSKATFKIIASPVPWSYGAKPGSLDPWQGYQEEREEIFSFLETNKMNGIALISADRHRSDAWKIEREKGYDLYEFMSSRLTNIHTHAVMPGSLFGYNEKCSFGLLKFDTTKDDPTLAYEIYSIDNELIHKITLNQSQLVHDK